MILKSKLRTIAFFNLLLCLAWSNAALAASGSFERTVDVDAPIVLDVTTGSGYINISAGKTHQVEIKARVKISSRSFLGIFKRSSEDSLAMLAEVEANPPIELVNGVLKVGHFSDSKLRKNVSVSYDIIVPASTEVVSHTGSGSQEISDVAGPVDARAGSGRVRLNNIGDSVIARSGSGSITANEIAGAFDAKAGSGSIRLTQVAPGDVKVRTGSGSSVLDGVVGGLQVWAGSGRVEVSGRQEGNWSIDTGSGSVKIRLPEDAAFELDAHTGSGGIRIEHPLTVQGTISKKHIQGDVRGGGNRLAVETGSGSIRID